MRGPNHHGLSLTMRLPCPAAACPLHGVVALQAPMFAASADADGVNFLREFVLLEGWDTFQRDSLRSDIQHRLQQITMRPDDCRSFVSCDFKGKFFVEILIFQAS